MQEHYQKLWELLLSAKLLNSFIKNGLIPLAGVSPK